MGDHDVKARGDTVTISIGEKTIYQVERDSQEGIWIKEETPARVGKISVDLQIKELHERYGHISFNTILSLPECPKSPLDYRKPHCEACEREKTTKPLSPKQNQTIRTKKPLERIHADLIGLIKPVTPGNQYQYLLVVVDDFSRYISVKPLKKKSEVGDALIEIMNLLENRTNLRTNQVQADWGGEFRNTELAIELKQ